MTKQEEVRDGLQKIVDGYDSTLPIDKPCPHCEVVIKILNYLHSKGVVIKVDRELPPAPWAVYRIDEIAGKTQQSMLKAGYVAVEELI